MAKLYFYYGCMGSSKTAQALMTDYNYKEIGKRALLAKTDTDTRDGQYEIRSRTGLSEQCFLLSEIVKMSDGELEDYDAIIVDEIQFAKPEQIDFLASVVDRLDIPVICYGLKTDFQNKLFPGSKRIIELADKMEEIKTVCWCGHKATCNARYNKFGIVREGDQVELGANDKYVALCRKHFNEGLIKPKE